MKPADRILARRYARAFVLGQGDGPDAASARVAGLSELSKAVAPLRMQLESPALPLEAKNKALDAASGAVGADAVGFAKLLLGAKRFGLLDEAAAQAREILDEMKNTLRAEISSSSPLGKEQMLELEKALARRTGKTVRAAYRVEPELLGGLRVRAGDLLIDNSVKGRLQRLKDILQETGRQP